MIYVTEESLSFWCLDYHWTLHPAGFAAFTTAMGLLEGCALPEPARAPCSECAAMGSCASCSLWRCAFSLAINERPQKSRGALEEDF